MVANSAVGFGRDHALALLKLLQTSPQTSDNGDVLRIYFLDLDVVSDYVGGVCGDVRNMWSSLFSLTPDTRPQRGQDVSADARDLANAIAVAVSGFLLGRFRNTRRLQGGRLWLTPELARELDSMVHAVISQQSPELGHWQEAVGKLYNDVALGAGEVEQAKTRLKEIFSLLIDHAPGGKVARMYDVRHRSTSAPEQAPIFPPPELGQAFLMRADTSQFLRRTEVVARQLFEKFVPPLLQQQRTGSYARAHERVQWLAFAAHSPDVGLRHYAERAQQDDELRSLLPESLPSADEWIESAVRVAARRVSDVYSTARLIVLGEHLNSDRPLRNGVKWQVNLISGALVPQRLLSLATDSGLNHNVTVVHPLSAMRFDEFLRPSASLRHGDIERDELAGEEYALTAITKGANDFDSLDHQRFLASLLQLLSNAAAAFAPSRDRSLRKIGLTLRANTENFGAYVRTVGSVVSSEYIRTFVDINALQPPYEHGRLPMVSLPWLTLPLGDQTQSAADRFVAQIHSNETPVPPPSIDEIVADDPTGYTACTCAALCYLSMGKGWLKSAEMVVNTASRMALIAADTAGSDSDVYIPEGNEALYLSAFISRMRLDPDPAHRIAALHWRDTHRQTMTRARERFKTWTMLRPTVAQKQADGLDCSKAQLVIWRYDAEDVARDVFSLMLDVCSPVEEGPKVFESTVDSLATRLHDLGEICTRLDAVSGDNNESRFIRAQLLVSLLQTWICVSISLGIDAALAKTIAVRLETLVHRPPTEMRSVHSALLENLIFIFERHTPKRAQTKGIGRRNAPPDYAVFAEFDKLRSKVIRALRRLTPGASMSDIFPLK